MKISLMGCGKVGAAVAYTAMWKGLAREMVLVDVSAEKARGEMLDILQCQAFAPAMKVKVGDAAATAGSDIVVITAGVPRKADEPRVLLLSRNAGVVAGLVRDAVKYSPDCLLFIITNPLDVMVQLAYQVSNFPAGRVIGMGTVLDTFRYRSHIGEAFHVDAKDVDAYVIGEHGETMVPITTGIRVRGIPLADFPGYDDVLLERVVGDVIRASGEVIALKGGTVFAPATAASAVLESIVLDSSAVLPVCTYNQDYGVAVSLPTTVSRTGAGKAFSIAMSAKEEALLARSVDNIKAFVADMKAGMGG